jgi:hypothetical protein
VLQSTWRSGQTTLSPGVSIFLEMCSNNLKPWCISQLGGLIKQLEALVFNLLGGVIKQLEALRFQSTWRSDQTT